LFIGNGTLEEGAPVIGNTEILTEFSDILAFQTNYTYKGQAAGYTVQTGPTAGSPVTQSLQTWLDQFATVKDFGATGDGITDDTAAINRALFQLYCREVNPQIRRGLFFPAGVYKVSSSLLIPPFAYLYGEGPDASLILYDTDDSGGLPVIRTTDSLQQEGVNIGTNGATTPQYVTINSMGFTSAQANRDIFLIEYINDLSVTNCKFSGPLTTTNLTTDADDTACVRITSSPILITSHVVISDSKFTGCTYGVNTDYVTKGVTFTNGYFDTLYQGVMLGTGTPILGGPTGFRITGNIFDNIYAEGIIFGTVTLNASGHNVFYDVGNNFAGLYSPATYIIDIQYPNNVSISDLFGRPPPTIVPTIWERVHLGGNTAIATVNGEELLMGTYRRTSGLAQVLVNNSTDTIATVSATAAPVFKIEYSINRVLAWRTGVITVAASNGFVPLSVTDDFDQNTSTGVTLTVTQVGTNLIFSYTTTNTGFNGAMGWSVTRFSS
jgi:hypothetical protein